MSAPYDQDDPAGDNTPPHGYKRPAVCDLCVTAPAFCLRRDGQCLRTSELGGAS